MKSIFLPEPGARGSTTLTTWIPNGVSFVICSEDIETP